jgi:Homeodomain-like domain
MAGKSPVVATQEQIAALERKAVGSDRAEADRARAILLTLRGWTSPRLAEAFGVREDTVRLWRSEFMDSGVEALETRPLPGPEPVKTQSRLARRRASSVGAGDEPGQLDAGASGR